MRNASLNIFVTIIPLIFGLFKQERSTTVDLSSDSSLLVDISDALSEKDKVKFTVHTKVCFHMLFYLVKYLYLRIEIMKFLRQKFLKPIIDLMQSFSFSAGDRTRTPHMSKLNCVCFSSHAQRVVFVVFC